MNQIGDIVDKLNEIHKKYNTSLTLAINSLQAAQRNELQCTLSTIVRQSQSQTTKRQEVKTVKAASKAEEVGRFLGKLIIKLEQISAQSEQVVLTSGYANLHVVLLADIPSATPDLQEVFQTLSNIVMNLDALKCLARKKQGKILLYITENEGLTLAAAAKKLGITTSFAERLSNFTSMANRFPALVLTGYSFETALKYKKAIEEKAENDENFKSLLELNPEINFEAESEEDDEEDEDELLSAME